VGSAFRDRFLSRILDARVEVSMSESRPGKETRAPPGEATSPDEPVPDGA